MAHKPLLPPDVSIPLSVNGWHHDPDAGRNAHVWRSDAETESVGVFAAAGSDRIDVRVFDDRVRGFERARTVATVEYDAPDTVQGRREAQRDAVAKGVRRAVEWMKSTAPSEWSHSDVCEAVFDPPSGYRLEEYYLERRTVTIYYQREETTERHRLAGGGEPDEYTPETCPYLFVHVWRGSGSATVALAPWKHAHGPGSKYQEIESVAEPPDECGLEVAITVAREWARETVVGDELIEPSVGQAALSDWENPT
jgi:hypothetical protein